MPNWTTISKKTPKKYQTIQIERNDDRRTVTYMGRLYFDESGAVPVAYVKQTDRWRPCPRD